MTNPTAKIFRRKSGKSKGKWAARISYRNDAGESKSEERLFPKLSDAKTYRDKRLPEISKSSGNVVEGDKMTFAQLADICSELFFQPAVIIDGRKIEGVRSYATAQNYIKHLKSYFGKRLLNEITIDSLINYRRFRLKQGSQRPELLAKKTFKPISIATINREFSMLRRILRHAHENQWITRDSKQLFSSSKVIRTSDESERKRILNAAEEASLLKACQGERQVTYRRTRFGKEQELTATVNTDNPRLKAVILLALDSGLRRGEILKLRWQDFDIENNLIRVVGTHTKTEKSREAPLTDRVKIELENVRVDDDPRPFPFKDFKRAWQTAKRIAGIEDLHFHDLRRTAITRWQIMGLPLSLAGKMAGHTQLSTTMKYYSGADAQIVSEFAARMNAAHNSNSLEASAYESELVN